MEKNIPLWMLGALQLTPYGLCAALSLLLGMLLVLLCGKKQLPTNALLKLCLYVLPCALIGSHLVYCLARIQTILVDYQHGALLALMPWMGGYTLYGSILGLLGGCWLASRGSSHSCAQLADAAAPGAAIALAGLRMAEFFSGEGIGAYVEDEALQFFPLAFCTYEDEYWSSWNIPVFFYEAMAALVILAVLLVLLRRTYKPGTPALTFLSLLALTQIFLESLRQDEFIRFGFVRFNQIMSAVTLLAILLIHVVPPLKAGKRSRWLISRLPLFVLCVGIIVAIEFALDKSSINNVLLYVVMVVTLVVMGFTVMKNPKGKDTISA